MDYIPSIFQFDQSIDHQELCQIISNNFPCKYQQDDEIQLGFEDHHHKHQNHQARPPTPSQDGREDLTKKRRRPSSSKAFSEKDALDDDGQANPNEKKKKIVIHRETERQRRKEMASLYASLRSLIPLQHLKGKRSISDQMHVGVNYIQELQRKSQELRDKRDRLKKLSNSSCSSSDHKTNNTIDCDRNSKRHNSDSIISVRHSREGIEVVVNTAFREGLQLARVLRVLGEQGLDVVTCFSVKVNERFLHTIESEAVSGERNLDLTKLEQNLKNLIV